MRWDFSTYLVAKIQSMKARPNPGRPLLLPFERGAATSRVRAEHS
jgi:hypothetical protein